MEGNENGLDLTAHIIDLQKIYILARKFKSFIASLKMTAVFYSLTAH